MVSRRDHQISLFRGQGGGLFDTSMQDGEYLLRRRRFTRALRTGHKEQWPQVVVAGGAGEEEPRQEHLVRLPRGEYRVDRPPRSQVIGERQAGDEAGVGVGHLMGGLTYLLL